MRFHFPAILLVILLCAAGDLRSAETESPKLSFEEHVRPILKTHCFYCHGEGGEKESGLDLRLRRWLIAGGESGPAIVAGKPANSLLLRRIKAGEMPPGDDKHLATAEIDVIQRWIEQGAPTLQEEPLSLDDEPHFTIAEKQWWAFQAIERPSIPTPYLPQSNTPIDALILARMSQHGPAVFAEPAGRPRLIRRLYLDLLGLPPTPEEVDAFTRDQRPGAWERLVDRVLASPAYGERWGRHWLDVAGYADSEGYSEKDTERPHAFHFRDYVIRSFNQGKPYDLFVHEQLAGDEMAGWPEAELTPDTVEQLAATGFLRMAPDGTADGGDQNVARNQVVADTLQIVGVSLTGMTMHCAQCHDHRYDPIPTADYYRMRAIFEPALDWKKWKTPAQRQISLYTQDDIANREKIEGDAKTVDARRQQRVDFYIAKTLEHELLMLEASLRGPLRTAYKTAVKDRTPEQKKLLESHVNIANIRSGSLYLYDRRREARAKALDEKRGQIAATAVKQIREQALAALQSELRQEIEAALAVEPAKRSDEQQQLLKNHPRAAVTQATIAMWDEALGEQLKVYETAATEIRKYRVATELKNLADEAKKIRDTIPTEPYLRPLTEPTDTAPSTFVFHRGDPKQPKDQVQPAGLSILNLEYAPAEGLPSSGRRLGFAKHLTNPRHPLVARAFVNRVWLHHFGRGLAPTPGDFGRLGQQPTHPKVLDLLASELIRSGWNTKQLHREILNSRVYQQSTNAESEVVQWDPENRWYSRWSPRRMEAEIVRDSMLAIGGQLNELMYGEPVPVMEDSVGQIVIGKESLDGERKPTKAIPLHGHEYRRSLYIQVRRSRPLSVLESFDLAENAPHCAKRATSNVTPQALVLMNSDFAISASQQFAARLVRECPNDVGAQVRRGWLLAYGSVASDEQVGDAVAFINAQTLVLKDAQAALATFCQALFSSSRFLYIE